MLVALGAPPWVGTRAARECEALQKIILPLAMKALESAVHAGRSRLLTSKRVIEIASGETLLSIHDDPHADRFGTPPRFHDMSPDESYVLSTGENGHFELRDVESRRAWRPALPEHGGVHTASFLPGGKAVLGTAQGGVIVVDCAESIAPRGDWYASESGGGTYWEISDCLSFQSPEGQSVAIGSAEEVPSIGPTDPNPPQGFRIAWHLLGSPTRAAGLCRSKFSLFWPSLKSVGQDAHESFYVLR